MTFTSLAAPGELAARRALEKIQFEALRDALVQRYDPAILYRAMLFWTRWKGRKDGAAHFSFVDMFGASERLGDRGEPVRLEDPDFHEWMRLREIRSKREWQRERAKRKKAEKLNGNGNAVGQANTAEHGSY